MNEQRERFWIVWCPTGSEPPTYRHVAYDHAVREAERLARIVKGKEFYVMASETMRVVDDMKCIDFNSQELPF